MPPRRTLISATFGDPAGRDILVVAGQRVDYVTGGQAEGTQPVRIDVDAISRLIRASITLTEPTPMTCCSRLISWSASVDEARVASAPSTTAQPTGRRPEINCSIRLWSIRKVRPAMFEIFYHRHAQRGDRVNEVSEPTTVKVNCSSPERVRASMR